MSGTGNWTNENWPSEVKKAAHGKGVDLIIDQVSGSAINQNLEDSGHARPDRKCRPSRRHEPDILISTSTRSNGSTISALHSVPGQIRGRRNQQAYARGPVAVGRKRAV